jgi:hypothetical protein
MFAVLKLLITYIDDKSRASVCVFLRFVCVCLNRTLWWDVSLIFLPYVFDCHQSWGQLVGGRPKCSESLQTGTSGRDGVGLEDVDVVCGREIHVFGHETVV